MTRPTESEMDDFWSLVESNHGPRIMHKLIAYIPERRVQRERWVAAMQRGEVPLRVIDGEVDPISGAHMVTRYRELIPNPDTVLLAEIGHYPQTEAPTQVLKHYLEFRDRLILPPRRVAWS
jgi:pimeloyl-ACP methyl ester carboxylesterase